MADIMGLLKKPSFIFMFVELLLAMVTVGLQQTQFLFYNNPHEIGLVYTVTGGFILILAMHILERIIEETSSKKMAILWSLIGAVLWFAAGGLMVNDYNIMMKVMGKPPFQMGLKEMFDRLLAAGIVAIINGFVFLADLAITFKFE